MRKPLLLLPVLVPVLCLNACGGDGSAPLAEEPTASAAPEEPSPPGSTLSEPGPPDPPDEEPSPQSTADFGEALGFAYAVGPPGGEPEEADEEAEVVYTVDGVERPWAGRVDFTVTVEVPDLERTFPLADMEVVCEAGPEIPVARTEDPLSAVEQGTHRVRMWCEIPEDTDQVRIVVMNGDDEASFGGSV
ncbi:hypothetical protein [Nocardiopsis kunsanensis]|uniref:Lipoprotein n=1 Tax=Nocardiopsis kunsanensis TaxID=141693 RepID=A0A918X9K0_9ACTN|nr:hypothetical protein [Nocardiopsis kunsanensis]GHD20006.1 hypothetical protein GCM10007147_11530 [Nocardiopsis kunsanensis]